MKRPIFLTIWLVLMTIGAVFSLFSYTLGSVALKIAIPTLPNWALGVYALASIANLIAVVMLWMWKKMGFYIFVGMAILIASLNGMIMGAAGVMGTVLAIIGVGILYLAMKPVWKQFK